MVNEYGGRGVVLHLGSPAECVVEMAIEGVEPTAGHPWVGKILTFTGDQGAAVYGVPLDRHAQVMLATWAGCLVLPRVTKKTEFLVLATGGEVTANALKARDYGIPIVPETVFLVGVGIPADAIAQAAHRWTRG